MVMKRIVFFLLTACCCLAACGSLTPENGGKNGKSIALTKGQTAVMEKGNDFAFNLLREANTQFAGDNLFLSPMGVTIVASMLANGAEGPTYDEIVAAIGLKGYTLNQINDCYATLVSALYKVDPAVSFSLANSLWAAKDLTLRKQFCSNMEKTFDAESYNVDFGAPGTLKQVNDWCSKKTSGLIPKMFDELDARTRMLLINALYFKGDWVYAFDEKSTSKSLFQTLTGDPSQATFMSQGRELEAYQDENVSLVKLPYGNGSFLMEAIVPSGDFNAFLSGLSLSRLQQWDQSARVQKAVLRFPKFTAEFDTEEQLVPVLMRLGMKRAFSPGEANFSNMSNESLYVSNFRQKTFVKLDEKGTEAAAVTIADLRKNSAGGSDGLYLNFDRPFVYLIRESSTGAILFIGTKVK